MEFGTNPILNLILIHEKHHIETIPLICTQTGIQTAIIHNFRQMFQVEPILKIP